MDARFAAGAARFLSRNWPFLALLALWQAWVTLGHVQAIVMPAPFGVAAELARDPGLYLREGSTTLIAAALGLAIGTFLAALVAVLAWSSPFVTGALTLPALLVQSTPVVALLPVISRVMGYDRRTIVAATVLITFFPTLVLIASGLRALPAGSDALFSALGAGRLTRLRYLALPAAIPSALTALRISSANCILAALVAEYLMGTSGLGRLFAVAQTTFDTDRAWAACVVATAISVAAFLGGRRLENFGGERFRI
jgi:NitT/TauT family transport system permease protein